MVQCNECKEWFHGKCVVKRWPNYFCPDCTGKGFGRSFLFQPKHARSGPMLYPPLPPPRPHRRPIPRPTLPGMSHISRAPAAQGAPPGEESFALPMGPPPPPARERGYTDPLPAQARPIQTGPLSPNRNGDACVYPSVPEPGRLDCLHRPNHHVIAAASRDLLGFYFQRKCLSLQGTALRAQARNRLFTRLVGCGAAFLRQRGFQFFCYLDMLVANSPPPPPPAISTWPSCYRQLQARFPSLGQVGARPDSVPDFPRDDYDIPRQLARWWPKEA